MDDIFDDFERAAALIRRLQDARLRTLGLTKAQFNVLRVISGPRRLPWTYTELAAALQCDIKAVTDAVKRLGDLVAVISDPQDKRKMRVTANPRGRRIVEKARVARREIEEELLAGLDDEQLEALSTALGILGRRAANSLHGSSAVGDSISTPTLSPGRSAYE